MIRKSGYRFSERSCLNQGRHDPEKRGPVFGKIINGDASAMTVRTTLVTLGIEIEENSK
jgi:hypothetical protein